MVPPLNGHNDMIMLFPVGTPENNTRAPHQPISVTTMSAKVEKEAKTSKVKSVKINEDHKQTCEGQKEVVVVKRKRQSNANPAE